MWSSLSSSLASQCPSHVIHSGVLASFETCYIRGWDGWMASLTQWTWVWVDSRSWWWTGRPGVLWFMGSQSGTRLSDWTDWLTDWYTFVLLYLCSCCSRYLKMSFFIPYPSLFLLSATIMILLLSLEPNSITFSVRLCCLPCSNNCTVCGSSFILLYSKSFDCAGSSLWCLGVL